ncbi:hypothetical protein Bca4012_058833 [Brassica carinata]
MEDEFRFVLRLPRPPPPRLILNASLEFPWGREAFLHTVRCMKPPKFEKGKPVEDPVGMLVQKLKQESFRLTGFPLALQLLAFKAIPMLQSKIPALFNELTIMELTEPNLPNHPSIELDSVLQVEHNPSLLVTPFIPIVRGPQPGWGVWPNVETDQKVAYMEQLIANNHRFTKSMWPGGDCSEPLFKVTPTPEEPPHKKHTVPRKRKESKLKTRKVSKKRVSTTSQRRITRLFAASTSTPAPTNELLEDRVISLEVKVTLLEDKVTALETTVSTLRASNERLKARVNSLLIRKRKRSTAGSLLSQFVVKRRKLLAPTQEIKTLTTVRPKHPYPSTITRISPVDRNCLVLLLPDGLFVTGGINTFFFTTSGISSSLGSPIGLITPAYVSLQLLVLYHCPTSVA